MTFRSLLSRCLVSSSLCSRWLVCPAAVRLVLAGGTWRERCWRIRDPRCRNLLVLVTAPAAAGGWGWPAPSTSVGVSLLPHVPCCTAPRSPLLAYCHRFLFYSLPASRLLWHFTYPVCVAPCCGCSVLVKATRFVTLGLPVSHTACPGGERCVGGAFSHVPPHLGGSAGFPSLLFYCSLKRDAEGGFVTRP